MSVTRVNSVSRLRSGQLWHRMLLPAFGPDLVCLVLGHDDRNAGPGWYHCYYTESFGAGRCHSYWAEASLELFRVCQIRLASDGGQ